MIVDKDNFFEKYDALAEKHQDGVFDEITLIVKSHLLLEELFRDYCAINGGNFRKKTFHQVYNMTRDFYLGSEEFDWTWKAVEKLNKLRNIVAHQLEPSQDEYAELKDAIATGSEGLLPYPNTLKSSLAHLLGFMLAMLSI